MPPLPRDDIAQVLGDTAPIHPELSQLRILITGATGFFGRWLIESLLELARVVPNARLSLVALSRDPAHFIAQNPHLAPSEHLRWLQASVATLSASRFPLPAIDAVIHLATVADKSAPAAVYREVIVEGTRRVLDLAAATGARRFLFTSTGAVSAVAPSTGHRPLSTSAYPGAPEKLEAEQLCLARPELGPVIARCYTFAGPGLPLDGKFAFGNFFRDALAGRPIVINGDGTPIRSYLYASDLTTWLLTLLCRGDVGRRYEVGSTVPVSIRQLAEAIDSVAGGRGVEVRQSPGASVTETYLPQPDPALTGLGLRQAVDLETAIRKTLRWQMRGSRKNPG